MSNQIEITNCNLTALFSKTYSVDYYQREYVWKQQQMQDLLQDLSAAFLKDYLASAENQASLEATEHYDQYFMGEIVFAEKKGSLAVIDGQQRITSLSLLLIYIIHRFHDQLEDGFLSDITGLVRKYSHGKLSFRLSVPEREGIMQALLAGDDYAVKDDDPIAVQNIHDIYYCIGEVWPNEINEQNILFFVDWLTEKVTFAKITTNSEEYAYMVFETMNDRGLSLTPVEKLRSYLLAGIHKSESRQKSLRQFDEAIALLRKISPRAENDFFKIYLRTHYAQSFSQDFKTKSDFTRIGNDFYRWVHDQHDKGCIKLNNEASFIDFIDRISFFAKCYVMLNERIAARDTYKDLYLIVNADYGFTLQVPLLMSGICYKDTDECINNKIKLLSRYLTKVLSWNIWAHRQITQNRFEDRIYDLCKKLRDLTFDEISDELSGEPLELPNIDGVPSLNGQNRNKLRVMLALITEIIHRASFGNSAYLLRTRATGNAYIDIEHIWANHPELHPEFTDPREFENTRDEIGDLLLLPASFNRSFLDKPYEEKVKLYYAQNILAQTLNSQCYQNNPGFLSFKSTSGIAFKSYEEFSKQSISERSELYKDILKWNWDMEGV